MMPDQLERNTIAMDPKCNLFAYNALELTFILEMCHLWPILPDMLVYHRKCPYNAKKVPQMLLNADICRYWPILMK